MASGRQGAWWAPDKGKNSEETPKKHDVTSSRVKSPYTLNKLPPFHAKELEGDTNNCLMTGLDITWDGKIVVADRNNSNVKLFSEKGTFLSSLTVPEKPSDVAVFSASKFAVCMWFQQIGIVRITDSDELKLLDTIKLEYNVWAITSYKDNLIITCATEPRSVKSITMSGDVVWSVAAGSDDTVLFENPYFITSSPTSDGHRVVISDEDRLTLTGLDARTDRVERVYDAQYGEPRGVTLDNFDNIYICYDTGEISVIGREVNNEVLLVDRNDGLKKPCSMEFNVRTSEFLLTTSLNDSKTDSINCIHRYKI